MPSIGHTKEENVNQTQTQTQPEKQAETQSQSQSHERRRGGDRRNEGVKTRIVIVDGHTLFRRGVRNILELEGDMEVIGEAGKGREGLRTVSVCIFRGWGTGMCISFRVWTVLCRYCLADPPRAADDDRGVTGPG